MNTYPKLFSPIKIGETTVKNRVFMPPISTNLADKGYVTEALVEHYAARAKGGVGLIVTEVTTVEPTYVYLPGDMSICDDSYIPGWEKLTAAVHKYGARFAAAFSSCLHGIPDPWYSAADRSVFCRCTMPRKRQDRSLLKNCRSLSASSARLPCV